MRLIKPIIPLVIAVLLSEGIAMGSANESQRSKANDVHIGPNAIGMPLGRVLLIRKGENYCAVRFTRNWTGKTDYEQHAEYESCYQGNKTGNFRRANVKYRKEEVYYKKPSFSIFGHPISMSDKRDIRCGPIELWWSAGPELTFVYFNRHDQKQGDYYGIELAPTKWGDIAEVNAFDPRLTWYRYDDNRQRVNIPIDRLWDDKEGSR
ncbi:hypothetical protein [Candidatus Methylomirabilis sp.]|uniref:hypothetical protein n=1 Tax=Candidatus Methylomirabilis sp. TaxID=2032687 RepID=UPI0030762B64